MGNPYDALAADLQPQTDAVTDNPYDAIVEDIQVKQQQRARTVYEKSLGVNPDQAAESVRLAKQTGLPPDAVERNLEEVRRKEQARLLDLQRMAMESPVLARQLADPTFTKQAHDDIGTLEQVGQFFTNTGRAAKAGVFNASRGSAGVFQAGAEFVAPILDPLEKIPSIGGNPLRRLAEGFAEIGAAAGATAKANTPKTEGNIAAGYYSGIQSLTQNLLALPMAFLPGGQPFALSFMTANTGGQSYQDAREQGLSMSQALPFAASQAAIEYATERIPLSQLIGDVKAGTAFFKMLGKQIALEVPGEQIATALQDMNEWAVLPENKDKPFSAYIEARPDAFVQTLVATIVGTGGNVTVAKGIETATRKLMGDAYDAGIAEQSAEQMQAAMQAATQSMLRQRNPEEFRGLMQQMAENTEGAPQEIYLDAEVLNQLPQDVLAQLPASVLEQLPEALAANDVVGIPVADVLTVAPGTPLEQALIENARIGDPMAMTQAEAKVAGEQAQQFLMQEAERVIQQATDQQAMQESSDRVKQMVLDQLNTANRFRKEVNEAYASLHAAFWTTVGGRYGVTAEQMMADVAARRGQLSIAAQGGQGQVLNMGSNTYPLAPRGEWYGEGTYKEDGGRLVSVSPDEYLAAVRPLTMDDESRENIDLLKEHIQAGKTLDPLLIRADGKEDGRHRAYAAKELGMTSVPVIVYGDQFKDAPAQEEVLNQSLPSRWPTSKKLTPSVDDPMLADLETLRLDEEQFEKAVAAVSAETGMRVKARKTEAKLEQVLQKMVDNLLWLHDQIPPEIRERSKKWYDGARAIADDWSIRYGKTRAQTAGILAVLSPQKDWFMNVTMGERVLDILSTQMDHKFDDKMRAVAFQFLLKDLSKPEEKRVNTAAFDVVKDKTLREAIATGDQLAIGVWMRAYDEAHHDAKHTVIHPEGDFGENATTMTGSATLRAWSTFEALGKAASIFIDGSAENINTQLGIEHKVRNFYNNIFEPNDPRFTTIDTHAVAAALVRPMASEDKPVKDAFGKTGGTNLTGVSGTYPIYYEAYKRAAEARGILPREMQSITWEAIRGLYTAGFKGKPENKAQVDAVWKAVDQGKLTVEEAYAQVLELAGGITHPDWWNGAEAPTPAVVDKTYVQEREPFTGTKVTFEVAPDPNNQELTDRWNALSAETRLQISKDLGWFTAGQTLAFYNSDTIKGELHLQTGGYLENTNPSMSLWMNKYASMVKTLEISRILGYVLDQDSMMVTSPKPFKGGDQWGTVEIHGVTAATAKTVYDELRANVLDESGQPLIQGHTTGGSTMAILVPSDARAEIANKIAGYLGDRHDVTTSTLYAAWPEKGVDGYGLSGREADLSGPSVREFANNLRAETARQLEQRVADAEQRALGGGVFNQSAVGYGQPERDGQAAGQNRRGDSQLGRVDVAGVHYSGQPRSHLTRLYFGTGLKGQEAERIRSATDPRIKSRLYAYIDEGQGVFPEAGVGAYPHNVQFDNLYDIKADPNGFRKLDANTMESAILDAGFDGYYAPGIFGRQGVAILMGDAAARGVTPTTNANAPAQPAPQRAPADPLANRRDLPMGRMSGAEWKAAVPEATMLADDQFYYKDDVSRALQTLQQTGAGFETWTHGHPVIEMGEGHTFVAGEGVVVEALHGTTGDFVAFNRAYANIESDLGGGFYFTNNPADVGENYAGLGPDLTLKVELDAERISAEEDLEMDEARELAKQRYMANAGFTMPVFVRFDNPVVLGGPEETFLTYEETYDEETDEYGEPEGTLVEFIEALREVGQDDRYGDANIEDAIGSIWDTVSDNGGISATQLIELLAGSEGLAYATDYENERGALANKEILRLAFEGAGFDGFIDQTVNQKFGSEKRVGKAMAGMDENTVHFIAFKPTQVKSRIGNNGNYSETNDSILEQGPRGTFNPQTLELVLNENADLSTFLHETGHFFLEVMADLATQPGAPADIQTDMAALLKWFGVADLQTWNGMSLEQQRKYHERFAESFEQYLLEGKAPSLELQPLFRKFRAWLTNVYRSLKSFIDNTPDSGIVLSDEVRQVFDRMLASEEQIAQAEEVAGLLPDENATAEAIEQLTARSLRDLKWTVNARAREIKKLQQQAAKLRKDVEAEVRAEVMQQPVYAARNFLRTDTKLAIADLEALYAGEGDRYALLDWKPLVDQKLAGKTGLHPDLVAGMFGYESGDQLVRAILEAEPMDSVVEGMTDQRMLERHGDLVDQRAIETAANEAVHNEARARALATELKAQADMMGARTDTGKTNAKGGKITVSVIAEAAKQFAANVIAKTPIKDLKARAWQHVAAERRAGKRWQDATAKGETEEAVKAKQDQVLNNAAAKAANEAQAEAKKIIEFFRRVMKDGNEKTVEKGRDPDVVNAARAVLAAYGVAPRAGKSALEYMEVLAKNDPSMYAALQPSVQGALNMAQPLDALTMDELRGLHEEIQAMWHLAKRSRQMEVDGNMLDLEDAESQLQDRMQEIGVPDTMPGETGALTKGEERIRKLQGARAALRRVEQWADGMGQAFTKLIFQPVKDAADRYRADRTKYRKKYQALVDKVAPHMPKGTIAAPELNYTFGRGHNGIGMAELLHAILHTGNESNKRKLLLGRGWATENPDGTLDTSKWDAFVQRMIDTGVLKKEHYDFAQGVWDLLEETKPLAQKAHRDVFGRYFAEVTADAFDTPFGSYRGGYVPAQADPRLVQDAALRKLSEQENENMAFSFPTTNKGFTKSRTEYNRPLILDLRTISQHLDKVLLFSHMEPAARDVQRLVTRKGVSYSLGRIDPAAYDGMLTPWLNRAARQVVETPIVGDGGLSRVLSAARSNAGMALMFANVSNTLQQLTGFSLAAVKVKPANMMRATAEFIAGPREMAKAVAGASTFMEGRMENEIAAINDAIDDIVLAPSKYEKMQAWTRRHAYFMQTAMANTMEPIIWTAAYNEALENGQSEKDAVRHADSVIRTTQGSTLPEDVSRIETGPAYARIFTQFIGYFNMMANTNAAELKKLAADAGLKKGAGKAAYIVLVGMLIPLWVAEAIAIAMRGGPDDEDDDGYLDDWLAAVFGMGTIKGMFAMVPFVGQLANAGVNRLNDNPADDRVSLSPAVSLLEAGAGGFSHIYNAMTDPDKINARNAVRDVASAISITTGLPAYAIARPLGYLAGVADDRIDPTGPVDMARGLVAGSASPESKQ